MNAASRSHGVNHYKVATFIGKKFTDDKFEISIDEDLEQDEGHIKVRPDILVREKATESIVLVAEIAVTSLKKDLKVVKSFFEMLQIADYLVIDCNQRKIYHFQLIDSQYKELENSELAKEMVASIF